MPLWNTRLLDLVDTCSVDGFATASDAILAMADLLDTAPIQLAPFITPRASRARLARLLEADAAVCAALELVGPLSGVLLSRAAGGSASGMVKIVDEIEEGNLFAADPAIALVGAYGAALVKVSAHVGEHDEPG